MKRKNGISVLLATQNVEKTVELSIRSFVDFADEIIAVDNGSTDRTIEIVRQLESEIQKLQFYNVPDLPDLHHNRQFAFEKSQYNWICRFDSDFIAYTDGENDIKKLREIILNRGRSLWPISYGFIGVNLVHDFLHTGREKKSEEEHLKLYVPPPITKLSNRIYQHFTGMKFTRLGRWEGVKYSLFLNQIKLPIPYFFHCELKTDMDYFFRSERTNWREYGDFEKFPTLESYIKSAIKLKYNTDDFETACKSYMEKYFWPFIDNYDPEKYYPYPTLIKNAIEN